MCCRGGERNGSEYTCHRSHTQTEEIFNLWNWRLHLIFILWNWLWKKLNLNHSHPRPHPDEPWPSLMWVTHLSVTWPRLTRWAGVRTQVRWVDINKTWMWHGDAFRCVYVIEKSSLQHVKRSDEKRRKRFSVWSHWCMATSITYVLYRPFQARNDTRRHYFSSIKEKPIPSVFRSILKMISVDPVNECAREYGSQYDHMKVEEQKDGNRVGLSISINSILVIGHGSRDGGFH